MTEPQAFFIAKKVGTVVTTDLSFRARKILYAVVTEYITSGEPVGSRRLSKRYGINLSAATIRNVLADLTEAGYLSQPHTSAGRVPTELGFRTFVDVLVQMRTIPQQSRHEVFERIRDLKTGSDDIMREACRVLASTAGVAAVLTRPRPETAILAQLRFIPFKPGELLAVIVTKTGLVQNRVIPIPLEFQLSELERLHNYLETMVSGRSLKEIRAAVAGEIDSERGTARQLKEHAERVVANTEAAAQLKPEVVIEGQKLLFDRPEFSDAEKIRQYLRTFDERGRLLELLDNTLASGGIQVRIGSETELDSVADVSVITANYHRSGVTAGSVGLIGPTRMDYGLLMPLVGFTAQVMTDLLDSIDVDESGD